MCQGLWKNPVDVDLICPLDCVHVFGLLKTKWNVGLLSELLTKWNFKALMHFNT